MRNIPKISVPQNHEIETKERQKQTNELENNFKLSKFIPIHYIRTREVETTGKAGHPNPVTGKR